MEFTKQHEREIAEIKASTTDLDRRVRESLDQIEQIRRRQDDVLRDVPHSRSGPRPGTGHESRSTSALNGGRAGPLIAFVHIPKTAGGTVTSMLTAAYSKQQVRDAGNFVRAPEKAGRKIKSSLRREGRVSAGHVPYGFFRDRMPPDTRYMTFLREPVDRVLSHYYRHIHRKQQRSPARRQHRLETPGKMRTDAKADSLEEALVEMRLPQITNLATRFLSGSAAPPMTGDLPASALDDAKESLRCFAFIGIQERFEESLVLLQRLLGLGALPYRDRHVSSGDARPTVDEIPEEQRALIEEYNALDAELYRFGLELFEEAVAAADESFAADVEALRAQSATDREEEWHEVRAAMVKPASPPSSQRVD
jgi:hypothetical protein